MNDRLCTVDYQTIESPPISAHYPTSPTRANHFYFHNHFHFHTRDIRRCQRNLRFNPLETRIPKTQLGTEITARGLLPLGDPQMLRRTLITMHAHPTLTRLTLHARPIPTRLSYNISFCNNCISITPTNPYNTNSHS